METARNSEHTKEDYFEHLIETLERRVLNLAYTYVKDWNTAEDICQEVFIKVYEKLDTFEQKSSIKTWIYSITVNHCKDFLKSKWYKRTFITEVIHRYMKTSKENVTETHLLKNLEKTSLANDVLQLPIKYREVVILHYYEDLTTQEMSVLLNVGNSTIRTRLQWARLMLQQKYEGISKNE